MIFETATSEIIIAITKNTDNSAFFKFFIYSPFYINKMNMYIICSNYTKGLLLS